MHVGGMRAATSTGPMMPWASNLCSAFSASKSDCRVSVPPSATAFSAASWNNSAATHADMP